VCVCVYVYVCVCVCVCVCFFYFKSEQTVTDPICSHVCSQLLYVY